MYNIIPHRLYYDTHFNIILHIERGKNDREYYAFDPNRNRVKQPFAPNP